LEEVKTQDGLLKEGEEPEHKVTVFKKSVIGMKFGANIGAKC